MATAGEAWSRYRFKGGDRFDPRTKPTAQLLRLARHGDECPRRLLAREHFGRPLDLQRRLDAIGGGDALRSHATYSMLSHRRAVVIGTPAVAVVLFAGTRMDTNEQLDRYNVEWTSPSRDASGSMPLGNGDIGLNVWVEEGG